MKKEKDKEIVINKCFGGFELSHKAIMRYAKLSGFPLYAYTDKRDKEGNLLSSNLPQSKRMVEIKNLTGEEYIIHYYKDRNFKKYFWDNDIKRDNKILVKVVKELKEEANGKCAELKIVKIPADVRYEIEDYDGMESIHEKHKSWG